MLRRMLVAGYANGYPTLFKVQVEIDEDHDLNRQIKTVEIAAKHFGVGGPHVIFDVEKDLKTLGFINLTSEREWIEAPIFLEAMA